MYKIVRIYRNPNLRVNRRTIKTGLTLAEAQAHCKNPETSSRTATSKAARRVTARVGEWFDIYQECKR